MGIMAAQKITLRELILRFIPGVSLDTELQVILAVESCAKLIDTGAVPDDAYSQAFNEFYSTTWRERMPDCINYA